MARQKRPDDWCQLERKSQTHNWSMVYYENGKRKRLGLETTCADTAERRMRERIAVVKPPLVTNARTGEKGFFIPASEAALYCQFREIVQQIRSTLGPYARQPRGAAVMKARLATQRLDDAG